MESHSDCNSIEAENSAGNVSVDPAELVEVERTQTDVLNNHLLKSLLQRMNCGEMDKQFTDQGENREEFI
uniref:Uncharacterized protein n=1 Tax=Nyssomyia neivai TaxID=330878 RepID=A0A1L8D8C0_9DIPT